jgi:hypothetical protein
MLVPLWRQRCDHLTLMGSIHEAAYLSPLSENHDKAIRLDWALAQKYVARKTWNAPE